MMEHQHDWRMVESRILHDVQPRTIVRRWVCDCGATKETEHADSNRMT